MRKRITLFTADYSRPKGGLGRSLMWMVCCLNKDYSVNVCSPQEGADFTIGKRSYTLGGHTLFSMFLPFFSFYRDMAKKADALMLPVGPGGLFLWRRPAVPVISIAMHTYYQQSYLVPGQWWKRLFIPLEAKTLRMSEKILCACKDTEKVLTKHYRIHPSKIDCISLGIPDSWFRVSSGPQKKLQCLYVARLDTRKGINILVKAWPTIVQNVPSAMLLIIGDGCHRRIVQDLLARYPSSVFWQKSVLLQDLQDVTVASALSLCPSYLEGFGLAAAEAMASSVPVIGLDRDGLRALILHNETGVLVQSASPEAYAEAVCFLLQERKERERLGRNAFLFAKQHFHQDVSEGKLRSSLSQFFS